jgi:hypothetical protein
MLGDEGLEPPRLTSESISVGACAPASQASALTQAIGSAPISPSACSATSSAGCGESRIDEKRDALDRWAKRLHDIVERPLGNVVELRAVAVWPCGTMRARVPVQDAAPGAPESFQ